MIVDFTYRNIDFHMDVHSELVNSKRDKKIFKRWGSGAPCDSVSARIYGKNTFYALEELENSLKYTPRGSTIIDCGAFIGNHTVFWNRINNNKVVSIEPLTENFKLLEENISLNNCDNCSLHHCLISDSNSSRFTCKTSPLRRSATTFVSDPKGSYVSTSIDSVVDQNIDISFIKIDVEGSEFSVLRGAKKLLERCHPVLQIEIHRGVQVNPIMKYLSGFKYKKGTDVMLLEKQAKHKRKNG